MSSSNQELVLPLPLDGFLPDLPVMSVPPTGLSASRNWIYRDGKLMLRPGLLQYGTNTPTNRPMSAIQYPYVSGATNTTITVIATQTGWWKYDQTTNSWINISGTALTANPVQPTVFRVFYRDTPLIPYLLGTNGVDTMKKWNGVAATYSDAAGSPPKATCMAIASNRVILANLTSGPNASPVAIDVSALNDFETGWGATLTAFLADTPGIIIAMLEQGALSTAIYKQDAIYNMVAISDVFPFRFELKQSGIIGPIGPLAVAPITTGVHSYLAADGSLKQYDGVSIKDMGRKFQKFISDNADFPTLARSRLEYDHSRNELWVLFPLGGTSNNNIGVMVNLNNGSMWPLAWDFHSFGFVLYANVGVGPTIDQLVGTIDQQTKTIDEYTGYVPSLLMGEIGGKIFQSQGVFDDISADVITHNFETGLNPLTEDLQAFKTVHNVEHFFKKSGASNVVSTQLGKTLYGEDRTYTPVVNVDIGNSGPYRARYRTTARMLSLKLSGQANQATEWEGAAANISERGRR